jgi:hypothetical protein
MPSGSNGYADAVVTYGDITVGKRAALLGAALCSKGWC